MKPFCFKNFHNYFRLSKICFIEYLLPTSENTNRFSWFYSHEVVLCWQHNNSEKKLLKIISIFHNTSRMIICCSTKQFLMWSFLFSSYLFKVSASSKHCFLIQDNRVLKNLVIFLQLAETFMPFIQVSINRKWF